MRRLVIALALAAAVAVPATVHAGGWATVTLAPPPAGLEADETWTAQLTVLAHGVTPTDAAAPSITIRGASGTQTFEAKPTGKPGVYVANVVFPSAGSWDYEVSDGYGQSQTHTYAPVEIVPVTGGGSDDGVPVWPFAIGVAVLVAACAAALAARQRDRRPATQS